MFTETAHASGVTLEHLLHNVCAQALTILAPPISKLWLPPITVNRQHYSRHKRLCTSFANPNISPWSRRHIYFLCLYYWWRPNTSKSQKQSLFNRILATAPRNSQSYTVCPGLFERALRKAYRRLVSVVAGDIDLRKCDVLPWRLVRLLEYLQVRHVLVLCVTTISAWMHVLGQLNSLIAAFDSSFVEVLSVIAGTTMHKKFSSEDHYRSPRYTTPISFSTCARTRAITTRVSDTSGSPRTSLHCSIARYLGSFS